MRLILVHAVALFALHAAPATGDEKADADLKAMVGKWKLEKAELGGKDAMAMLKDLKFEITGPGKYVAELGEKDEGTFTVDPSKKPAEMDIKGTGGPNNAGEDDRWDDIVQTNLFGTYWCCRAAD
jgi:uncharacterized protein (TIGR03067 family)